MFVKVKVPHRKCAKMGFICIRALVSISVVLTISQLVQNVVGHGMLLDPPGRSSMWRFGFSTPINYDDNSLFCGGFAVRTHIRTVFFNLLNVDQFRSEGSI